ncbi:4'-phosphopantetheinyl transferase superfamily protein [Dyadobacter flavalbus]|uniref:4'-phosphopantetheinyl transferase superfamily protein n=1 Tax=Dyadobacter flavalbus TaxID=2579942 RepID=A0A5M8QGU9_9BACT|nr:4'-phosphopantetheinyl transferase superfamily protein [Dyadobacter flavalbus]KAA6434160.1 4'-phosphopantetheinyl transferase superfamily protein [Dyadobacter flavalbus]
MGICYIKTLSENTVLGLWKMTEPWQELKEQLQLTPADEKLLSEKKTDVRRQEWLACRILIKNITSVDPEITYDHNRKPHMAGSKQHISMSHSGEYACVYLSETKETGIDIQKLKPSISKGADYFLNEAEMDWVDVENNLLLHIIWSAKESAFKFAGDPDLDLKKHIITNRFDGNQKGKIEVSVLKPELNTVHIAYDTFDDYVLSWTI